MANLTRLIFGIRTSQTTELVVTGGPASTTLPLWITTRDGPGKISVLREQGTWTAHLPQGDHVVRIEAPKPDDWFEEHLNFTVSRGAVIVSTPKAQPDLLVYWSVMAEEGGGSDPKDPWPPPRQTTQLTLDDDQWFTDTLHAARANVAIIRSAPI